MPACWTLREFWHNISHHHQPLPHIYTHIPRPSEMLMNHKEISGSSQYKAVSTHHHAYRFSSIAAGGGDGRMIRARGLKSGEICLVLYICLPWSKFVPITIFPPIVSKKQAPIAVL